MKDFDGSQALYRLAFASGMRSGHRRGQSVERGGDVERDARAFDAAVEAVVLLQASAEAWINRQFDQQGLHGGDWRSRWNGLSRLAVARGRPRRDLSKASKRLLDNMQTVRNFLLHGDAAAKRRLEAWSGDTDVHDLLSQEFLDSLFQRAENLWEEAREITGLSVPGASGAWVASDEFQ